MTDWAAFAVTVSATLLIGRGDVPVSVELEN